MEELSSMTDKLSVQTVSDTGGRTFLLLLCAQDGTPTECLRSMVFPGGHEFTSFVLGLPQRRRSWPAN